MDIGFDAAAVVGGLAALASTSSFAPQAWKIIKTRETKNISAGAYSLTVFGFMLWFAYGILLWQWPLIIPNGICLCFAIFILVMKLLPVSGKHAVADALDPTA